VYGLDPFEPQNGTGIDDSTVTAAKVTLTRDGVVLVQGIDYNFSYDPTNDTISLIPLAGVWTLDHTYVITLDNSDATGIKDQAGNPLKPNRPDLTTSFTIELGTEPGVPGGNNLDFGDAPDPSYPTLLVNNGARHIIVPGIQLGTLISAEPNGQPNVNASGDGTSDDGVVIANNEIVAGRTATEVTVFPSVDGVIDAWIDFNGDGDWNDPGEQIFVSEAVTGGNPSGVVLTFDVPAAAVEGTTYARFRFSTEGGLATTGLASDGEVEDYRLQIGSNPYRNPGTYNNAHFDVNADGFFSPIDALLIINHINFIGVSTSDLPLPRPGGAVPPYLDVDGNFRIQVQDAQAVITFLNTRSQNPQPEPEGEFGGGFSEFVDGDEFDDVLDQVTAGAGDSDDFFTWLGE
jgi:hypothetical protein